MGHLKFKMDLSFIIRILGLETHDKRGRRDEDLDPTDRGLACGVEAAIAHGSLDLVCSIE